MSALPPKADMDQQDAETRRGTETRNVLMDFGFTPEALINNINLVGVDPAGLDALVLSHEIRQYNVDVIELPYSTGKDRFIGHRIIAASTFLGKGEPCRFSV